MRGVFVTGTDTGVGKTVVAGAICAALAARGERVAAFKPVVTGTAEESGDWPPDHELLASAASAGQSTIEVAPVTFGPPVSPHYAAELAGSEIDAAQLRDTACSAAAGVDALVCEGVGGLLVPLTLDYSVRDLAADLGVPLVIVARTGLGTINHTLLTVAAARSAGLHVAGVVMTPWAADPEPIERSNRATVERLSGVAVSALPHATPATLAAAGAELPLDDWL
ncbi:MAG TPA: dethiobiotin synthase [Thermoleophilaceae bacterium]|nr:dethiobiotin synthase [Thermoleophilaceae bacterium]